MAKRILKKYSKTKIKRFLIFLALASLLWILTKFGRDFSASMEAKIYFYNLPETTVLAENNPEKIHFDITASGFEILFYKFKKPVIDINVEKYYTEGENEFSVNRSELIQQLELKFNKYFDIRNLNPDPFQVELDPIILKEVVVIPDIDIEFKKGFRPIGEYILDPEFVTISGPKGIVESIDSIETSYLSVKKADRSISEQMTVYSPSNAIVAINPEEILFSWEVSEFSELEYTLAVEVINLPPGIELKLIPEQVKITFDMAVEDYKNVSSDNLRVICDYSKRNKEGNFMLPELIKQPAEAKNIDIDPKKVEFYVFK